MQRLVRILSAAFLALPLLVSAADARNVTANQLSAWGHGRQPTMTNRPSWDIYRRNRYVGPRYGAAGLDRAGRFPRDVYRQHDGY